MENWKIILKEKWENFIEPNFNVLTYTAQSAFTMITNLILLIAIILGEEEIDLTLIILLAVNVITLLASLLNLSGVKTSDFGCSFSWIMNIILPIIIIWKFWDKFSSFELSDDETSCKKSDITLLITSVFTIIFTSVVIIASCIDFYKKYKKFKVDGLSNGEITKRFFLGCNECG